MNNICAETGNMYFAQYTLINIIGLAPNMTRRVTLLIDTKQTILSCKTLKVCVCVCDLIKNIYGTNK